MRGVVAALVLVAGCDALWRIDAILPPTPDAPRALDAAMADGRAHTGPFAHFTMDMLNDDSTATVDSVGGYVATCQGGCPYAVTGHVDGALDFAGLNGNAQRLEVTADAPFQIVDQFSVAGWVQMGSLAAEGCLWSKPYSTGNQNSWQVCINSGGSIGFFTYGPGASAPAVTSDGWVMLDGAFHHVAMVFDGTNKLLYWDGEIAAMAPSTAPLVDADTVLIGNDLDGGSYVAPLVGIVDDVQFFDYGLTAAEVATLRAQ